MPGSAPKLSYRGSDGEATTSPFIQYLLEGIPALTQKYRPPPVWGTSGHLQTATYGVMQSRPGLNIESLSSTRHYCTLEDGSTVSYNLYEAVTRSCSDVTLMVCPGIGNSSENFYIRTFTYLATQHGYRVAVLNHMGVLSEEKLTGSRVFNFGSTVEYHSMVCSVLEKHPATRLIAVGFSLGGNIVCKYLGEENSNQTPFIACISLCQGYDFTHMFRTSRTLSKLRILYAKRISNKLKEVHIKNYKELSAGENNSKLFTLQELKKCEYVNDIDELVTIRCTGHKTVEEYYDWASSSQYIKYIEIPTLFVNAADDPLFTKKLLEHPRKHARQNRNSLFVLTQHGGHLGFYMKSGKESVDKFTWLELLILSYANRVSQIHKDNPELLLPYSSTTPVIHQSGSVAFDLNENTVPNKETTNLDGQNEDSQTEKPTKASHALPHSWSSALIDEEFLEGGNDSFFTSPDTHSKATNMKRSRTTVEF